MKVSMVLCACLLLWGMKIAHAEPADAYEKALQAEAADTAMQGQKSRSFEKEPPVMPAVSMAEGDIETLTETITRSLEKALAEKQGELAIRREMGSVVSGALGQGIRLDEIRDAVQSAMTDVQAGGRAEPQALKSAGKVIEGVIEANRQLIEDPGSTGSSTLHDEIKGVVDASGANETLTSIEGMEKKLVSPEESMGKLTGEQRHVVKNGESLSLIARRYYKDGLKYWKIYQANKELLSNPDIILVGQELKIPE